MRVEGVQHLHFSKYFHPHIYIFVYVGGRHIYIFVNVELGTFTFFCKCWGSHLHFFVNVEGHIYIFL